MLEGRKSWRNMVEVKKIIILKEPCQAYPPPPQILLMNQNEGLGYIQPMSNLGPFFIFAQMCLFLLMNANETSTAGGQNSLTCSLA